MKLLIVINQFYKGGAETNLLNLLKALPETDDQVDLLVYDQMKLPNVISLLPQVPPHVTVCDAAGREDGNGFWHKALCRITRDATKKQLYRPACFEFVKDKHYDAAISYGEWISPEFVAEHVQADRKIVWIHSDIDKALFFNEEVMFRFDDKIDLYLFASGKSMETALARYPIMQGRATVVHNLCDDEGIRRAAMEKAPLGYAAKIRDKIETLLEAHYREIFEKWLETERIVCKPSFRLPLAIHPTTHTDIYARSLYTAEDGDMNKLEQKLVVELTALPNVRWWHRNIARQGFSINGFIKHYPDILIMTQSGKLICAETKGDHLKNDDSREKIALGQAWRTAAGKDFRYYMVFENEENLLPGAMSMSQFIDTVKAL